MDATAKMIRANKESQRKSDLAKTAHRKALEKTDGTKIYGMCPCWINNVNGQFTITPEKRETVREIIRLAMDGVGPCVIAAINSTKPNAPYFPHVKPLASGMEQTLRTF